MDKRISQLDFPAYVYAQKDVSVTMLKKYCNYPCKLMASLFALCTEGSISVTINITDYQIKKNDYITLLPNSFLQIRDFSDDACLSFIGFSSQISREGEFFKVACTSFSVMFDNPVLELSDEMTVFNKESMALWTNANLIPEISKNKGIIKTIMLAFLRTSISLYQEKEFENRTSFLSKSYLVSREFTQLVLLHYQKEHKLAFYADKIGISVDSLCSMIKKRTSRTPQDIISLFLIMEAKAQLVSTMYPVKNIALSLGFSNLASFCKFFRKHVNISPMEYRNKTPLNI